ncbi:Microtubules assembly and stabilization protein [Vermiconidia calcicola]|uniref:Microtubules assembly and stabilization protein n=1 Tax=Vermiconidia calcicola TaxID=1690605 RepID=A0ACC3NST1_9PEZI|nr:Microtubules assembly and stabilization protein [Vermiconidia calcicola]
MDLGVSARELFGSYRKQQPKGAGSEGHDIALGRSKSTASHGSRRPQVTRQAKSGTAVNTVAQPFSSGEGGLNTCYENESDAPTPPIHQQQSRLLHERRRGAPSTDSSDISRQQSQKEAITPLLLHTASSARWRRRENNIRNTNSSNPSIRARAASDLVLKVAVMEEVHGVDVSWLHHPNSNRDKDGEQRRAEGDKKGERSSGHHHTLSSPDVRRDAGKATNVASGASATSGHVAQEKPKRPAPPVQARSELAKTTSSPPNITPSTAAEPARDGTNAIPERSASTKTPPQKRPSLLNRTSNEKLSQSGKRTSWMTSISSKFSSQNHTTPERPGPTPTQAWGKQANGPQTPPVNGAATSAGSEAAEEVEPYTPSKPKESSSSFFSSLTRRLSSASQGSGIPKVSGTGGVCARKVLNVDPNRERCLVPEMDPTRLRRVSFCVDVEVAGGPRYSEDEDDEEKRRKKKEFKMKERAEGEALKHPEALKEEKDEEGEPKLESQSKQLSAPPKSPGLSKENTKDETVDAPPTEEEKESAARKKEKKMRSEAERKERQQKRRRRAEENGQIPVELMLDGGGSEHNDDTAAGSSPSGKSMFDPKHASSTSADLTTPQPNTANASRPTTDPARIYRRCCQLRESPILKRITEQLSRPNATLPTEPGVVACLDLTGSRLQLADVVSLGDWLAVVPVKHLKLEDADLNDEGVRCILAGLLAAKRPEPTRRKDNAPKHRTGVRRERIQERSGEVEKLTLKNNPRLTRVGWKHVSLFIYMCRSLKAVDLSMNFFPDTLPPGAQTNMNTPVKSPPPASTNKAAVAVGGDIDAAEALYKCLSERLGGTKLEELIMSECGLSAPQVRKVVDGAIVAGISRLGLAGNNLDEEGLGHVLHYLCSGVCQALDLGGNDLRSGDKLALLAEALDNKKRDGVALPCWGLSLAGCNLDPSSLKLLFASIVHLPNFRFIDLSHNPALCSEGSDNGLISLLRRYIGQMKDLKRIHLADVGMSPKQAIALADVLPEGPRLAHLNLLGNKQLSALADARTEGEQEEACALYASLMASVRVPSAENSEIVKALAKQVVAYSLRNMEQFAIAEATGNVPSTANATTALTGPYGGEKGVKEITVPDVLMHLVGHDDGSSENHDDDGPAPDEDYIVGGTGVVRALQYVLGEKENENRRNGMPSTPTGTITPRDRPGSSAGLVDQGKAKKMSKNLLGSARKIRERLQPALVKEQSSGDDLAYRRLLFLDQTLQSMIQRFEEEYPETRLSPAQHQLNGQASQASSLIDQSSNLLASSANTQATDPSTNLTDEEDLDEIEVRPTVSRHGSDVNIASRALSMEEGRLHRIGQHMRREVIDSPHSPNFPAPVDAPWRKEEQSARESERIRHFGERIEAISGVELKTVVADEGWEGLLRKVGGTYEDLRSLQQQDPEAWEAFRDAQEKARLNVDRERPGSVDAGAGNARV